MSAVWGRLLAIGAKEPNAYRQVELRTSEFLIGRKDNCHERIADQIVSSVHLRITLVRSSEDDDRLEVRLEDNSANGTYVNAQKVGKGNCVTLVGNDEIGFVRPCGGAERPPWAFMFQDFTDQLTHAQIAAILGGGGASAAAAAPPPAAVVAVQSVSKGGSLLGGLRRLSGGSSGKSTAEKDAAAAASAAASASAASAAPDSWREVAAPDEPSRSLYASMRAHAGLDPSTPRPLDPSSSLPRAPPRPAPPPPAP